MRNKVKSNKTRRARVVEGLCCGRGTTDILETIQEAEKRPSGDVQVLICGACDYIGLRGKGRCRLQRECGLLVS